MKANALTIVQFIQFLDLIISHVNYLIVVEEKRDKLMDHVDCVQITYKLLKIKLIVKSQSAHIDKLQCQMQLVKTVQLIK